MEYTLGSLDEVSKYLIQECSGETFWVFDGEMGAGKTTLIKALCAQWEVEDAVSSPTFSIVNEYITTSDESIYHFDFYRIVEEAEAEDIGLDSYFYSGNKCLIEWASKIPNLIPDKFVVIEISLVDESTRRLQIKKNGE